MLIVIELQLFRVKFFSSFFQLRGVTRRLRVSVNLEFITSYRVPATFRLLLLKICRNAEAFDLC